MMLTYHSYGIGISASWWWLYRFFSPGSKDTYKITNHERNNIKETTVLIADTTTSY